MLRRLSFYALTLATLSCVKTLPRPAEPPVSKQAEAAYRDESPEAGDAKLEADATHARAQLQGAALSARLRRLGELAEQQWRYPVAERLYTEALSLLDDAHSADALADLARIHRIMGRYPQAAKEASRAIELRERALGKDEPSLGPLLQVLAFCTMMTTGDFDAAEKLGRRALALAEREGRNLNVAENLNNLAAFLRWSGKTVEAERRYREALHLYDELDALDSAGAASAAHNLSGLMLALHGATPEVSVLEEHANHAAEASLGPRHPFTIETLEALANIYRLQQRGLRSLDAAERARKARSQPPDFCVNARGSEGCLASCSEGLMCPSGRRCVSLSEVRLPRGAEQSVCLDTCSKPGTSGGCPPGWFCSPLRNAGRMFDEGVCAPP